MGLTTNVVVCCCSNNLADGKKLPVGYAQTVVMYAMLKNTFGWLVFCKFSQDGLMTYPFIRLIFS